MQRSEVIAQIKPDTDKSFLLGEHRWEDFMEEESIRQLAGKQSMLLFKAQLGTRR